MKNKIILPISIFVILLISREIGIFNINAFTSEKSESKSNGFAMTLNSFKNIGTVEVIDLNGNSKNYTLSDYDVKIRLSIKDALIDYSSTQWIPFYKSGRSNVRLYFNVENNVGGQGWNKWACIAPLETEIDLKVIGVCSAFEYRKLVIKDILNLNKDSFVYKK